MPWALFPSSVESTNGKSKSKTTVVRIGSIVGSCPSAASLSVISCAACISCIVGSTSLFSECPRNQARVMVFFGSIRAQRWYRSSEQCCCVCRKG